MPRRLSADEVYPARDPRARARFISVSGFRVRLVEAGPSDGPPVVCVAGWASSSFQFRKNLPALADAGYHAIAVDLPGQGESDKPTDPAFYTVPWLASQLIAFLDALSLPAVALVGQSLGGAVALGAVRQAPRRVRKLALIAPVGLSRVRPVRLGKLFMPRFVARVLPFLAWRFWWDAGLRLAYGSRARPTAEDVDEYWAPTRDPVYVRGLQSLVLGVDWNPLGREELAKVDVPVLVLCGSRDRIVRLDEISRRVKWLPNAELVVIEGAGHPLQEEVPDEANARLVAFLGS